LAAIESLPEAERAAIEAAVQRAYASGPPLAMVSSERGITNLHVPSDVIIDASIPAAIRASGQMWNARGEQQDTKFVIPDHSYAQLYAETIDDCRAHGAFDPATMGATSNVGLMAQAAEEYGSHDKTFEIAAPGTVRVVDGSGATLMSHEVDAGDIWRMCQTKDAAITDWVALAVARARASGAPAVFWLDESRAHDAEVLRKVRAALERLDTRGLEIEILDVAAATRFTLARARRSQDTISATGNVLRDYLTDLFPILELGTSAKMLSIVPLMSGGGLFETGAGGSAPRHVEQFLDEDHLRWDSLGEFLALAVSLELLAEKGRVPRAALLAQTLDRATGRLLEENRSPSRRVGELDNRGSHFYLALYWARELSKQTDDPDLAARFAPIAQRLDRDEAAIVAELARVQGQSVDIGGYYRPDLELVDEAMRPSPTLNEALETDAVDAPADGAAPTPTSAARRANGASGRGRSTVRSVARGVPLVALGYGKYVRADRVFALIPLEGAERGDGRRTLVYVDGIEEPVVASRSEAAIARDVASALGHVSARGRAEVPGQEPLF
jgi:isocitrate dehydrogenase